ncbi:MAG: murein transglycosylase domain-containing protein, partial [Bacteroidota bacterium]|nr:murein transglycosylase domain-containing protein [Bacteroidota bacterium]
MKTSIFLSFVLSLQIIMAQGTDDQKEFDKFKKEQAAGIANEESSFQNYKAEVTKQYDDYKAEQDRLMKEYTGQIEKKWGIKKVSVSTKKEYVSYNASFTSRSKIDFEKGTAKVEVLMTVDEAKNQKLVEQKLKEQLTQTVLTKGGTDPLEVKDNIAPETQPLLADQVQMKDGQTVTEKNANQ